MKTTKNFTFKKFSEFKTTANVSKRLLGLLWRIDKWLFIGNAISVSVPAIVPFVNAYIYKLIIDLVVNATTGLPFQYDQLYLLIATRALTLFIQDAAFSAQHYFDMLLWTKFPVHLYQAVLTKLSRSEEHTSE